LLTPTPKKTEDASFLQSRRLQRFAVMVYALLLILVSLLPGSQLPSIPDWNLLFAPDKVAHFGAYAIFALLLSALFTERRKIWGIGAAVLLAAAFGALLEVFQGLAGTGRNFDPVDMVANLLGALIGGIIFFLLQLLRKKPLLR
jgi:VanZ family protein